MIIAIIVSIVILAILVTLCAITWYMIIPDLIRCSNKLEELKKFLNSKYGSIIYDILGIPYCVICMIGAIRVLLKGLVVLVLWMFL